MEKLKTPEDFIPPVLERVKKEYLCRVYRLKDWKDHLDFLDQVARRTGKLLKGGEPDNNAVARMILNDWQRGKLPFFVAPVNPDGPKEVEEKPEGEPAATVESGEKDKKKFEPRLAQDFSKIRVDLKYEGDDVRPLEEQPELALDVSGDEGEDDEEEGDNAVADKTTEEPKSADVSKTDDGEWVDDEEEDEDNEEMDEEDSDGDGAAKKDKTLKLKSRTITKSGAFSITPTSRSKKGGDDDRPENPRWKLTSRERRKIDRDQKKKKVGTHFYEVVNVKNKSKKKGFLEMAKAFRGHCKK